MAHPYVDLLRDRHVRVLWSGLTLSSLGSELYRVGAIWLAAELAGPKAALLVTAQSAAVLAMSILAGPVAEALPRRRLLIWTELAAAAASATVVIVAVSIGLTFPVLIAASVLLASIGAVANPVMMSSLPRLAPPENLRPLMGLFDGTLRAAQSIGPFVAAAAMSVMPAIHLLTANAVSFLASAAAVAAVGRRLEGPEPRSAGFLRRLARGVTAANNCPGVWSALMATSVRGGAYALGFTVAVPLLFSQSEGSGGLGAVALVFGAAAAGELLTMPLLVVLAQPKRPLRRQFEGYVMIGVSLVLLGAAAALPGALRVAAMTACAALMGIGGAIAHIQLVTFFGTRLSRDDHAAVLRLRLAMVIGAMMLSTAAGPFLLPALGTVGTTLACGAAATFAAVVGMLSGPARRLGPGFEEPADLRTGEAASKLIS
jgi:DHA3 family macrolide efflux protein-like MFS transporter